MAIKKDLLNSDFSNYRDEEFETLERYVEHIEDHRDTPELILYNWPRFVRSQEITRFLVYYEIFKMIENVHGSIMQIGVLNGNTLFSYAHFSEIFEHRNYTRKIYGFDTFGGYESKSNKEKQMPDKKKASVFSEELLNKAVKMFNESQVFKQFDKIQLIKGDVVKTVPKFLNEQPETICSLLNLHISLYKPEFETLKRVWPIMPIGSVIHFGSLSFKDSPSVTQMLQDALGISNLKVQRFNFATKHAYLVKE